MKLWIIINFGKEVMLPASLLFVVVSMMTLILKTVNMFTVFYIFVEGNTQRDLYVAAHPAPSQTFLHD